MIMLMIIMSLTPSIQSNEKSFSHLYYQTRCEQYTPMEQSYYDAVKEVFKKTYDKINVSPQALESLWDSLGFQWLPVRLNGHDYWMAAEKRDRCRGYGLYLFNPAYKKTSILQVPHRFKDDKTGHLALKLVPEMDFLAFAWNTVPRDFSSYSDFTHNKTNFFTAMSEMFAETFLEGVIVQIHGFSKNKRKTIAAQNSDVIVSSGTRSPMLPVKKILRCLKEKSWKNTAVYPYDVSELGATTNWQGVVLREHKHLGFVHIELSKEMRDSLYDNHKLRTELTGCLTL